MLQDAGFITFLLMGMLMVVCGMVFVLYLFYEITRDSSLLIKRLEKRVASLEERIK